MFAKLSKIAVLVIVTNHLWSVSACPMPTVRNCRLNLLKISSVTLHSAVYKFYCNYVIAQAVSRITQYGVTGSA